MMSSKYFSNVITFTFDIRRQSPETSESAININAMDTVNNSETKDPPVQNVSVPKTNDTQAVKKVAIFEWCPDGTLKLREEQLLEDFNVDREIERDLERLFSEEVNNSDS